MILTCIAIANTIYLAVPDAHPSRLIILDAHTLYTREGAAIVVDDPQTHEQWRLDIAPKDRHKDTSRLLDDCAQKARARP